MIGFLRGVFPRGTATALSLAEAGVTALAVFAGAAALGFKIDSLWLQGFGIALLLLTALVAMHWAGLYRAEPFIDMRQDVARGAVLLLLLLGLTIGPVLKAGWHSVDISAVWRSLWPAAAVWLCCIVAIRFLYSRMIRSETLRRRVLVVGGQARGSQISQLRPGVFVDWYLPTPESVSQSGGNVGYDLLAQVQRVKISEIVVATEHEQDVGHEQRQACRKAGIEVIGFADYYERETGRVDLTAIEPSWFIFSRRAPTEAATALIKRVLDLVLCVVTFVGVFPVMAVAAAAIKLESPGPVFYRQERVGLRGRRFVLLKFRSMRNDAEVSGTPLWAAKQDPRVTRVGSFIRKLRIDELPQLYNVLRGDMSFVGPRPERPYFVDRLAESIPYYHERHAIKPGITGWAQVNYPYGASVDDARQKLAYDLYYLKNRGLLLDIIILILTFRVVLWAEGAR